MLEEVASCGRIFFVLKSLAIPNNIWTYVANNEAVSDVHQAVEFISLAIDNSGTPYISYTDSTDKVKVMKLVNNAWEDADFGTSVGNNPLNTSLVINNNIPYVAYY